MASRARDIRLHPITYRALEAEASQRHVEVDELADEFIRDQLMSRGVLIKEALESLDAIVAETTAVRTTGLADEPQEQSGSRGPRRPAS